VYWRQLVDLPGCPREIVREASEALAVHHEHRLRDLRAARGFALHSLQEGTSVAPDRWVRSIQHRVERLERKLLRQASEQKLEL